MRYSDQNLPDFPRTALIDYEKSLILGYLGYPREGFLFYPPKFYDSYPPSVIDTISNILLTLENIDIARASAIADSMVVKLDDMSLDYGKHLRMLVAERNNLINELATVVYIPRYNAKTSHMVTQYQ